MSTATEFITELTALPASHKAGRFAIRITLRGPLRPTRSKQLMTPPLLAEPLPEVVSGWTPPIGVRDLIPGGNTTAAGVYYLRETSITDNAAVVAPPNKKPESTVTYEGHVSPVATVAHFAKLSRQLMDDSPALEGQLNTRLLYFLAVAEDLELLTGTGVSGHTDGLLPAAVATTGAVAPLAGNDLLNAIAASIIEISAAGYSVNGIVLNSADWATIVLMRTAFDGAFLVVLPGMVQGFARALWGFPVIPTPSMPVGQFLVGDFQRGAQVFDREEASIVIANQNEDDFVKDLITVRAEERLALAVYQPGAFRKAGAA